MLLVLLRGTGTRRREYKRHDIEGPKAYHPSTFSKVKLELLLVRFQSAKTRCFKFAPLELRQTPELLFPRDRLMIIEKGM